MLLYNLISSFGAKPASSAMITQMARATFTDEELASVELPVHFVAAERDAFCPPEVMARASRRFRSATMDVLAGASHSAYYEEPSAWNDLVLRLADQSAARP